MRFRLLLLLMVVCFFSCKKKVSSEIKKNERIFNSAGLIWDEYVEINLDSLLNYGHLLSRIDEVVCEKGIVLRFNFDQTIYKIKPINRCHLWDYKLRQVVYLNTDSIFVNEELKYPVDSLNLILDKHLNNKTKDLNYAQMNELKFVQVFMNGSKTIDKTKKVLVKIISSYDEIKKKYDSISFGGISLDKKGVIKVIEQN